ncbi:unnamed protein product [Lactuca virosa]|uniref:DUF659 domain-containing protein n=1 Tax=Lactuca virosa TaxID=75947 RepID=A0AAU9MW11_9ASTR|nr:unnamed protein product [Lactuca virosa]
MFYTEGLPFNIARNPHYLRAFQFAVNNKIDGYVPLDYNKLRTTLLQKEKYNVHMLLDPLRSTWKEKGVTIANDGCSDPKRKPLINFMATSVARWAKNNTPLHCLAHSLNPCDAWLLEDSRRCAPHRDGEISQEKMKCFRRLFLNDDEYSKVHDEYAMFSMKSGPFEDLTSIS